MYEFRVLAETTVGTGPFSPSRSFTTPEDGIVTSKNNPIGLPIPCMRVQICICTYFHVPHLVPTEPRDLTVTYLNSTALEVTWQNPLCDYGVRRGYTVSL